VFKPVSTVVCTKRTSFGLANCRLSGQAVKRLMLPFGMQFQRNLVFDGTGGWGYFQLYDVTKHRASCVERRRVERMGRTRKTPTVASRHVHLGHYRSKKSPGIMSLKKMYCEQLICPSNVTDEFWCDNCLFSDRFVINANPTESKSRSFSF